MKIVDVLKQSIFCAKRMSVWALVLSGLFVPSRVHALTTVNTYTDGDGIVWHMSADSGEEPTWSSTWVKRQGVVHITSMVLKEKHKSVSIPSTLPWDSGGSGETAHPTIEYMSTDATDEHPWLESVGVNDLVMLKIPCFKNCPVLKSFRMDTVNPVDGRYAVESGVLFSKDFTSLKKYPEGKDGEEYSVPSTVTELMDSCFANTRLCRIRFLGNAPQTVADNVFSGSDSLAYVCYSQGASGWSSTFKGKPAYAIPNAVTSVSASHGTSSSSISVIWSENSAATAYKIYRSESSSGSKILLGTVSGTTLYTDTSASADRTYYYTVVAVNGPVTGASSSAALGWLKGLTYTITYRPGSLGTGSVQAQSYSYGVNVKLKEAIYTSSGRVQTGWTTVDGGEKVYDFDDMYFVNADLTLYPAWAATPTTYTVSFNANGGSGTMTSQTITYGVSTSLKANTFTKNGYAFAGWATTAGGSVVHSDGASVSNLAPAGGSITLYAVWYELATCTIVFDANGGTGGTTITRKSGENLGTLPTPTRIGYKLIGWQVLDHWDSLVIMGGGIERYPVYKDVDLSPYGRVVVSATYYAKWQPISYTVRFLANGGTGTMADQTFTYDNWRNLTVNAFTKSGYAFAGWATTSNGAVSYADGQEVHNLTSVEEEVPLYAVWTVDAQTYTVTYKSGAYGSGSQQTATKTHGVGLTLQGAIFTRSGYTQTGWATSDGGSLAYALGASYTANAAITLYPVWSMECPSAPTGVSASDGSYADYARVTWSAVSGATSYNLYRSTTSSRPSTATKTGVTSPYSDTTATPGTKYYYWIAAVNSAGTSYSSCDTGYRAVSLTLGKSSDAYASTGGSGSVSVTANTSWSASTDASWITFGTKSASGNGTVTYTVAANTSSSSRSGTITVTAGSGTSYPVTKTITVTQGAASDFVISDGVLTKYTGAGGAVTIPSGVTSIGEYAFRKCSGLTSVTIPSSVTSIGKSAFDDCRSLTSLTISSGVKSIGNQAFFECSGLTTVTIPSSVTSIGIQAFAFCKGLTSVTIPSSVTSIGTSVFEGCSGLTSVTMSAGMTSIGKSEFYGCSGLTSVTIPSSVTNIGDSAFEGCSGLTTVKIPSGVLSIGYRTFYGCSGLTSVTIPSSVTNIGTSAFAYCSGLRSVTIPSSVTCIGNGAFAYCSGLTTVTIPSSVTSIEDIAFYGCGGSFHVSLDNPCYSAIDGVLFNKNASELIAFPVGKPGAYSIPSSVTNIGYGAFGECSGLTSVTIPTGVTCIDAYAFAGCNGLTSVTIPSGVTRIEKSTFYQCSGLTSVTIPSGVTSIDAYAFEGCSGLTSVTIPQGVTCIEKSTFYQCSGLTSVTIPSGVTSIGDYAFYKCSGLMDVTIPSGVTSIGSYAFYYCSGLTSVAMPSSLTKIGADAFEYCSGLTSVTIPSGVTSIGTDAFGGCDGLMILTIPSSVTSVGRWAFSSCSSLKVICVSDNGDIATLKQKLSQSGLSVDNVVFTHVDYYSVSFNANGGVGSMTSQNITYGVSTALKANVFTCSGYVFAGWATTADGPVAYADNASVLNLALPESSVTLYAVWEKLVVPTPGVTPADGATFSTDSCLVTLDCALDGAAIYYTTNGTTPKTSASYLYTKPFEIRGTVNVKAVAVKDGVKSEYVTAKITKVDPVPVETPVITPVNGTTFSTDSCEVTITCPTDGATIYYTTDGTLPTVSESCRYKGAFSITDTATIKAIAVKGGWLDSACATVTITKVGLTLEGVLGVDSRVRITTGGEADWVPVNDANAKEGGTSARSGLGNADDDSVSWIQLSVNGKGTLSFWYKTSCEHDDDNTYTWDRVEVMVDGQAKSDWYMDGTSQWVQRTIAFDTVAEHAVRIAYVKDVSDYDGEDCAWLDGVVWTPVGAAPGSLPDFGDTPSAADVAAAVADAADPQVAAKVDATNYNDFRAWAGKVKAKGGSAAGVQGVMSAENAWLSFALGQDTLLETVPTDGDLAVEAFEPTAKTGTFEFTVSVKDVEVGSEAAKENLKKVFGLEGAATLDKAAFSSDKVEIDFSTPVDGKVKFTATPKDVSARAFFMRVKMLP